MLTDIKCSVKGGFLVLKFPVIKVRFNKGHLYITFCGWQFCCIDSMIVLDEFNLVLTQLISIKFLKKYTISEASMSQYWLYFSYKVNALLHEGKACSVSLQADSKIQLVSWKDSLCIWTLYSLVLQTYIHRNPHENTSPAAVKVFYFYESTSWSNQKVGN